MYIMFMGQLYSAQVRRFFYYVQVSFYHLINKFYH